MQRQCDEEGACETGAMSDCIVCHWIDEKLEVEVQILPYNYHGKKGGVPFTWTDYQGLKSANSESMDAAKEMGFSGVIPEKEVPLDQMAAQMGLNDPKKQQFHTDRAIFTLLTQMGFMVQTDPKYQKEYSDE